MDRPPAAAVAPIADPSILLYHRVCPDDQWRPSEFLVAASVFRAQLRYLARAGYYTPRLSEVLAWNGRAPRTPRTPVVLTFDDGYADNFEVAFPILQELGFTAAVFPVLDLGRRFSTWEAEPAMHAALMSPESMRTMEAAGIEFGSHTMTHPRLPRASDAELVDELTRSREVLGAIVARPLAVVAYPYGEVDPRVKRAALHSGYTAALAVHSGPLRIDADPLEIRRVCVANSANEAYMKFKASGAAKLYEWFKSKAKERLRSAREWTPSRQAPGAP